MPRRLRYGLTGLLLALGAPAGLLLLRAARAGRPPGARFLAEQLGHDPLLYIYLSLSTAIVFALFGLELGRRADHLTQLSALDPLTGLLNLRALSAQLATECARASRYGRPVSLLMIDIDGLKQLNDKLGHLAGDAALVAVAGAVRRGSRSSDAASRWGGDEFALIAPDTDRAAAVSMAERICELAAAAPADGSFWGITVSIGVATWPEGGRECGAATLRRDADAALYEAKRAGGNCVRVWTPAGTSEKGLDGRGEGAAL